MELSRLLERHHAEIVDTWAFCLLTDASSHYSEQREEDLRPLVDRAAAAFRLALSGDDWSKLNEFVDMIARRRLQEGFTLSEVQRAFIVYAQTLIPILTAELEPKELAPVLLRVVRCVSRTVEHFSEYFQGLHQRFIRNQAAFLEAEVERRTRELAESESKYKTLVEDIRDGYFAIVGEEIAFANEAFCAMHGYAPAEVVGAPYLAFVAAECRDQVQDAYLRSRMGQNAPSRVEFLRLHRDGRRLATEITAKLSSYGGMPANIGICRDVSERAELEQKTREAEKLSALAQQAASLAHDIRNPLTAIKMNVQMLRKTLADSESVRLAEVSLKEVLGIERSVLEMMDLARPFRLAREVCRLGPLFQGCVDALRGRMKEKRVTASIQVDPEAAELKADPHRLEQALVNLLFNAIEALPEGGQIFLSARPMRRRKGAWTELRVADDGPGIPAELLPYVFDGKRTRGIGLGLGNVKRIVEAHGGSVHVRPRRPRGVCFFLRLPRED